VRVFGRRNWTNLLWSAVNVHCVADLRHSGHVIDVDVNYGHFVPFMPCILSNVCYG